MTDEPSVHQASELSGVFQGAFVQYLRYFFKFILSLVEHAFHFVGPGMLREVLALVERRLRLTFRETQFFIRKM